MLKKHLCVIITLLACVLGFPSFSVSAESSEVVSHAEMSSRMYDAICSDAGLTGDPGDDLVYYIYGYFTDTENPTSIIWVGSQYYGCTYNKLKGTYYHYSGTYSINFSTVYIGRIEIGSAFYFDPSSSGSIQFVHCYTDNVRIKDIYPDVDGFYIKAFNTYEEASSEFKTEIQDPSEGSGGSSFELPDEWLSGGETLPSVEDPTFPASFVPDEAFGYIEDYTVELDEGTKSGIGFFWAVLTGVIGALGIWDYVFFSLLMGLLVWVLRGVF